MDDVVRVGSAAFPDAVNAIGQGLLGAVAYGPHAGSMIGEERLRTIERRILRIEMAMRQTGIDVEQLELPR